MKSIKDIASKKQEKIWVIIDQAIFSGGSFVTTILSARLLGAESFGFFASIILFAYLSINLTGALVIQPLQVSLTKIEHKHSYISFCFWLQTSLLVSIVGILWLALQLGFSALAAYASMGFGLVCFLIGFISQDYFRKLFLAQSLVRQALAIDAVAVCLQLGILIHYLYIGQAQLEYLLWYLGLGYFPSIAYSILLTKPIRNHRSLTILVIKPIFIKMSKWNGRTFDKNRLDLPPKLSANQYTKLWHDYARMHYQQGKWLVLTALAQWWSSNLFVVASGLFLGMQALGAFRLVQSLFGVLNLLLQTFENYVLPETARLLHQSPSLAKTHLRTLSLQSAAIFGLILLFVFTFSAQIIVLAGGAEYMEYAFVVKGMAILYLFIFISYPVRLAIRALVLNKHFFQGYLLSLAFSLISFQYLLREFHLIGAIGGLIGSQIILLIFWQFILAKHNFSLWK